MLVTMPRFILAEFNTHRMFSRNAASSRAIPFKKMVETVQTDPFIPIAWQKDHPGMQGTEYHTGDWVTIAEMGWKTARDRAIQNATILHEAGATKQLCNRLLEPFMWVTDLVTATEWENFFKLRCPQYEVAGELYRSRKDARADYIRYPKIPGVPQSGIADYDSPNWLLLNKGQAEIHMMALAEAMWDCLQESKPKELAAGQWHIPFGDDLSEAELVKTETHYGDLTVRGKFSPVMDFSDKAEYDRWLETRRVKVATARAARVSYTVVGEEGKPPNYENDIKLHDRLLASGHFSPFEHCAKAMDEADLWYWTHQLGHGLNGIDKTGQHENLGWCRNFHGWLQYRALIDK